MWDSVFVSLMKGVYFGVTAWGFLAAVVFISIFLTTLSQLTLFVLAAIKKGGKL